MKTTDTNYTVKDIYTAYVQQLLLNHPEYHTKYDSKKKMKNGLVYAGYIEIMSYEKFKRILGNFFKKAQTEIIAGGRLNLTHNLGAVYALRKERNHSKKRINFKATNAQGPEAINPKTGRKKAIFYTDDDYCRIAWAKRRKNKHIRFYQFLPTDDSSGKVGSGFLGKFSEMIKADAMLKYKFTFRPIVGDTIHQEKLVLK